MTKLNEIYKCQVCANIVEVVHAGEGELVCCGKPMKLMTAGTTDGAAEKHVPVVTKESEAVFLVKVGSVAHPMVPEHYIEWIELETEGGKIQRKYLKAGEAPQARFCCKGAFVSAREYCNIHGLWETKELSK